MNVTYKTARTNGNSYRIITATLWGSKKKLMSAECFHGPNKGHTINDLNASRSTIGMTLKGLVKRGLVS